MKRLQHIYAAVVFSLAGGFLGAAITFRWLSEQINKAVEL